ncbi:MAG: hypothetical protein IPM82_30010 [Saprospiraceae bacterium]|nr:hypothetical protein [Saprospiraceae bacterium]
MLIHRVYRSEYANIVMFLTHLSKDSYIMDTLMGAAKRIFEEYIPTKLDDDVFKINEMIKALPEQVIEEFEVEQKREEELDAKEQSEIEAESELELEELEDTNASLDEDISAIDYFAKINLAFKTLDLLGQLAKAYWGELDANEKSEIVLETYNLGLRTLNSFLNLLQNSSREIVDHVLKLVEEKHIKDRHTLKKTVEADVMNFIFNTSFLTVWGVTKRISNAVGTDKLKKTYSNILNEHPFVSYKLINLSIDLDHNTRIPFEEVKQYSSDFNKNNLAKVVLQNLIINHLYLFETGFREKQKICSILGIKIHDQRLIDNMSQRKSKPIKSKTNNCLN